MGKGIFVTGTDTEVGKTFVSFLLARFFLNNGIDTAVIKPVSTGGKRIKGETVSPDALFLKKNLRLDTSLSELNPLCLKAPLSPYAAAKIENKKIDVNGIIEAVNRTIRVHQFTVVEGIGGVDVPILRNYLVRDLIKDLKIPAVIVARPGLGTINHTLLTINELSRAGIEVLGIVINYANDAKKGIAEKTNARMIEEISGVPVICEVPFLKNITGAPALRAEKKLYSFIIRGASIRSS